MSVERAIGRFFRAIDECDWDSVRAGLADEVTVDYTSLFGGEVERLAADELVERWGAMLPGFDATQHLLGPLLEVSPGRHEANVRGYHHLDAATWMVAGWYVLLTDGDGPGGPVVSGITLTVSYETGPRALVEQAQARSSFGPRRAGPTAADRGGNGTVDGSG